MNWGHLLFGFSGRINRAKWWLSILAILVLDIVIILLGASFPSEMLAILLTLLNWIAVVWISLAAGTKRLHDLDKSAAWLAVFFGAPIFLALAFIAAFGWKVVIAVASSETPNDAEIVRIVGIAVVLFIAVFGIAIWSLVWLGCLRGTVGANRFGPDPLEGKP